MRSSLTLRSKFQRKGEQRKLTSENRVRSSNFGKGWKYSFIKTCLPILSLSALIYETALEELDVDESTLEYE